MTTRERTEARPRKCFTSWSIVDEHGASPGPLQSMKAFIHREPSVIDAEGMGSGVIGRPREHPEGNLSDWSRHFQILSGRTEYSPFTARF
jgi:hypothetical protein